MTGPNRKDYPWRRNRRWLLWGTAVFFCAAVLGLAVIGWRGERALQRQIDVIRAKGEPVTPQELRRQSPEPPKEQNAADTYTKSFSTAKGIGDEWERTKQLREAPTKDLLAAEFRKWADERLAENAEALALLHEAAHKPVAQFPVTLDKGWFGIGIPDLDKIRDSATLLQLESMIAAQGGDADRALEAVLAGLALGNALSDNPLILLLDARFDCYKTTCEGIRRILSIADFSDNQIEQLQHALDAADDGDALTRALTGERVMTLVHFDHPEYTFNDIHQLNDWIPGAGAVVATYMRVAGNHGDYLSIIGDAVDASRKAPWEALPLLQVMATSEVSIRDFGFSIHGMLSHAAYGQNCLVENLSRVRSAQTALAVERYRLANGVLPGNAGQLVPAFLPAVPTDPCNGQPLGYRPVEDGYVLYSAGAGPNAADGPAASGQNGDYIFRVAHPRQ
jgi:hypothetical protein